MFTVSAIKVILEGGGGGGRGGGGGGGRGGGKGEPIRGKRLV